MLLDLDQSVDLLCDFYNLDFQLDERIKKLASSKYPFEMIEMNTRHHYSYVTKSLSISSTEYEEYIQKVLDEDLAVHLNELFRNLLETGPKRFVGRRDRDRIKRFMNNKFEWGDGFGFTFEMWLARFREREGDNWFRSIGVLELLLDFDTFRSFIRDILQNRISEDVLFRIDSLFKLIRRTESSYWELQPKKQDYGLHSYRLEEPRKKVSNGKNYWELDDVKWGVNNSRLMSSHEFYGIPKGFIMKKALADSIQAIINNDMSVRKCILCDRIFRVPKVRGG